MCIKTGGNMLNESIAKRIKVNMSDEDLDKLINEIDENEN